MTDNNSQPIIMKFKLHFLKL